MTNDPSRDTLNCDAPYSDCMTPSATRTGPPVACSCVKLNGSIISAPLRATTRWPDATYLAEEPWAMMRRQRLEDDVAVVPSRCGAGSGRVDDRIAAWQEFEPVMRPLATLAVEGRQWLRLTAIGVHLPISETIS